MNPSNDPTSSPPQTKPSMEPLNMTPNSEDPKLMEQVFNYFDENKDGKISPSELQTCANTVGGALSKEEAEKAVHISDSDDDGLLNKKEFTDLVQGRNGVKDEELKEAFKMYAAEDKGCITPKSLKRMLSRLGQTNTVENCEAMITKFDANGDGVLSFDEFRSMMTR
ncbi:Calcium-binding protein CML38 [Heracleum sosnowskyi]|uniref:Calcium-binding protein CML38 n=1 Tax=Heracleum sosnowskyi TaxID=360622 RepID=A0AAD8N1S9_9APIA|nr:Calcium-binding protein CML38 [Heracleum sosnowskyi]